MTSEGQSVNNNSIIPLDVNSQIDAEYKLANRDTDRPRWLNVVPITHRTHVIDIASSCFQGADDDMAAFNQFIDEMARRWYKRMRLFESDMQAEGMTIVEEVSKQQIWQSRLAVLTQSSSYLIASPALTVAGVRELSYKSDDVRNYRLPPEQRGTGLPKDFTGELQTVPVIGEPLTVYYESGGGFTTANVIQIAVAHADEYVRGNTAMLSAKVADRLNNLDGTELPSGLA